MLLLFRRCGGGGIGIEIGIGIGRGKERGLRCGMRVVLWVGRSLRLPEGPI
jgi:hypothetical protein